MPGHADCHDAEPRQERKVDIEAAMSIKAANDNYRDRQKYRKNERSKKHKRRRAFCSDQFLFRGQWRYFHGVLQLRDKVNGGL